MNAICIYLLQIGKIDPTLQTHLDWFRAMFYLVLIARPSGHVAIAWNIATLRVIPSSWNMPLRGAVQLRESRATLTNPATLGPPHHPCQPTCTAHTLRRRRITGTNASRA